MPHRDGDDPRNVLLNLMVKPYEGYALSAEQMAVWDTAIRVRSDVNGILELARGDKRIGKSLEAHVTLSALDAPAAEALKAVRGMNLAELFIVSECSISNADPAADSVVGQGTAFPGLTVEVREATGAKCERCWMQSATVGDDADHPTLCARCAAVVRNLPQF